MCVFILHGFVREGLTEKVTFEQKLGGNRRTRHIECSWKRKTKYKVHLRWECAWHVK